MTHSPADIQDVLDCMTGDTVNAITGRAAFERILADLAPPSDNMKAAVDLITAYRPQWCKEGSMIWMALDKVINRALCAPTTHAAELEKVRDELREVLAFYKSGDEKKTPTETGRIIGYEECIKAITAIIEKKGA